MNTSKHDEIEIDLRELLGLLRSRIWMIIIVGILTATAAGLISTFLITPIYTSTTKLYIVNKSPSLSSLSLSDLQLGTQLTKDYMVLVQSRPVTEQVIKNLGLDIDYEGLVRITTISNPQDTRILEISVKYPDAYLAKEIVDEIAAVSSKRIASIMDMKEPAVVEKGYEAKSATSPNIMRNIAIGGILGLTFAIFVFSMLYILDDTIKSSEDVEHYLGLNTIGIIPVEEEEEMDKSKGKTKKRKIRKTKNLWD